MIGLPHLPDIPVSNVSGLLDESSRILPSLLPDYLLGQLLYGGTISASSVATVSAAFKDRYGVSASVLIVSETNAALYEGVYFIASAEGTSGIMSSLDARTGDWIVSNGEQWVKIDNTDAVSSVAGLTGVISKAALQSALADTTHRFVTDAQISGWNAKWEWDEEEIKAVKVDNATHADSAGSVPLSGIENMGSGWLSALSKTKPTTISGYGITDAYTKTQVNEALKAFVTLSTEQTVTGRKTFAEDVVFGADGGRMFIPSATPGTYDLFVDSGMAIEGDAPSGGAYLLNDLHYLTSEATSDDIEFVIGSYDALRQAIRNGKVIVDNRTMDYDYDRLVAVEALDGGNENFISLTFHSSMYQTRRYVISRDGSGNLSLTVTDSGSFLSDSHSYSQLDTENQTILGAINEVAGKVSDALPYWCGRVLSTGQLTKMSGSGNISVRRTAAGVYSVQGATPGMSVTVTPLNFTNSLVTLEPLTAAILQNSSNGLITIHIFNSSGTRVNSAFSLLII